MAAGRHGRGVQRRRLLAALAGLAAGSAGCVETAGDDPATPDDGATETPTDDEVRIVDESFTAREGDCGTGEDAASVSFDGDAVRVDGSLAAPTPCHGAALAGTRLADDGDRLVVAVDPTDPGQEVCVQCLGAVPYDATVRFEGRLPEEVRVEHDGTVVTTVERPTRPNRETER
jgi:hypothetical protein